MHLEVQKSRGDIEWNPSAARVTSDINTREVVVVGQAVNKRSDWQYITYIGALWQADIFLSAHPATIHILPKLTNQMPCYIVIPVKSTDFGSSLPIFFTFFTFLPPTYRFTTIYRFVRGSTEF